MSNSFENTKIVIVGGAGFVGSNLTKMILSTTNRVKIHIIDNLLSSEKFNIPIDARIKFTEDSITNNKTLVEIDSDVNYLFHLATYHGNQSSIHNPLADHENNTLTTLKLFEKIKKLKNIKKVVYSSAGCSVAKKTFDNATETTEEDPIEIKQDSPYSISKIIGEFYSLYYYNQHNLPTVRARFQNVFGPGEILGAGQWRGTPATVWRNVIPAFIYKALNGKPLPLENGGNASRDFIYVDDICKGLIACALLGKAGDVYNLASGKEITIEQLAYLINTLTNNKAGVEKLPKRTWDNSGKRFGSTSKAEKELQFKASVLIEEGLNKTISWTTQNMEVINRTILKHRFNMQV